MQPVRPIERPGPPKPTERDWQNDPLVDLLAGTDLRPRHLAGAEKAFRNAQRDPRDWLFQAMPHGGRVVFEVRGGVGMGDVDRIADSRVDVNASNQPQSDWFQEGPAAATRPRGALFIGYAPLAYLDLGVVGGLQYGNKLLTTGWTQNGVEVDTSAQQRVQAVQFYVQPRLRIYLAPTGPVKPYVFGHAELRVFDSFDIQSGGMLQYPEPPGGLMFGGGGGGGLMFDPGPMIGLFAEGAFTAHAGTRAAPAEPPGGVRPSSVAALPGADGYTIGVVGGLQFRI